MANSLSFHEGDRDDQRATSQSLARQLLALDTPPGMSDPERRAIGLRKTCARVSDNLRNALGSDGCSALLVRALTRAESRHPLLGDLRRSGDANVSFDGLVQSVDQHGVVAVTAAIEALLVSLLEILVRLVGDDMTARLVAAEAPSRPAGNGGGTDA